MTALADPCPFCGGESLLTNGNHQSGTPSVMICCLDAGCVAPALIEPAKHGESDLLEAIDRAVAKWNRRSIASELKDYRRDDLVALWQATVDAKQLYLERGIDQNDARVLAMNRLGMKVMGSMISRGVDVIRLVKTIATLPWNQIAKEYRL